jgi:hypothetical protein
VTSSSKAEVTCDKGGSTISLEDKEPPVFPGGT